MANKRIVILRSVIGNFLAKTGVVGYVVFGVWGLFLCLEIAWQSWGIWGVIFGVPLAPFVVFMVPWHALMDLGNPTPMLIFYGGTLLSLSLSMVGGKVEPEPEDLFG